MIPHSRPAYGDDELLAASACLKSGYLATGERVRSLEQTLAVGLGRRFGVAVSSGTAALHLSLLALGLKAKDTVAIPSFACSALLQAVKYTGAEPLYYDVDPLTAQPSAMDLAARLLPSTKAIIVPHLFGTAQDLAPFLAFGLPVIEDCAQTLRANAGSLQAGAAGTLTVLSFYPTKLLAGAMGGMLLCDDQDQARLAEDLRDYDKRDDFRPRFPYALGDLAAAIALSQWHKLDFAIARRRAIAAGYLEALHNKDTLCPLESSMSGTAAYFRFMIRSSKGREALVRSCDRAGIAIARAIHLPLHQIYPSEQRPTLPATEQLYAELVSIPLYPSLSDGERATIERTLKEVC